MIFFIVKANEHALKSKVSSGDTWTWQEHLGFLTFLSPVVQCFENHVAFIGSMEDTFPLC